MTDLFVTKKENKELSYEDKLKNFPSVNYISLKESSERRKFMEEQFTYFGITKTSVYQTERYSEIFKNINIKGAELEKKYIEQQQGTMVSYINLLRNWYVSTSEEYAIFCEDDISFESIKYWNFTWNEFIQRIPIDWECLQLIRMISPWSKKDEETLRLDLRHGRWWGSSALLKRSYVKKILDRTCTGYNEYTFDIIYADIKYEPIIENILFLNLGRVYNFPMFIENINIPTTYLIKTDSVISEQIESHKIILKEWQTNGRTLDLKNATSLIYE